MDACRGWSGVTARSYEPIPELFALIADLLPAHGKRSGCWNDYHTTLDGIFWKLYSGFGGARCPSCVLAARYPHPYQRSTNK